MNKELKISKMKCEGKKMYVFYNLTKDKGIKRMSPLEFTTLKLGDLVKIDGDIFILLNYFDEESVYYLNEVPKFNSNEEIERIFNEGTF